MTYVISEGMHVAPEGRETERGPTADSFVQAHVVPLGGDALEKALGSRDLADLDTRAAAALRALRIDPEAGPTTKPLTHNINQSEATIGIECDQLDGDTGDHPPLSLLKILSSDIEPAQNSQSNTPQISALEASQSSAETQAWYHAHSTVKMMHEIVQSASDAPFVVRYELHQPEHTMAYNALVSLLGARRLDQLPESTNPKDLLGVVINHTTYLLTREKVYVQTRDDRFKLSAIQIQLVPRHAFRNINGYTYQI